MAGYVLPYTGDEVSYAISLAKNAIAPTFSALEAYEIGDIVVYQNGLYIAKAAKAAGSGWNANNWDATTVINNTDTYYIGDDE